MNINRYITSLMLAGTFLTSVVTSGCAARVGVGYRYYDGGHRDYHEWNDAELGFYNRWTVETHRPPNREYRRLKKNEQRDYWNWRHNQH